MGGERGHPTETKSVLNGVKIALKSYYQSYGKPAKSLEDLLKRNNRRKIEFFENDEIPIDPLSQSKYEVCLITGVKSVVYNHDKTGFTKIIYGGDAMVVYSVGKNGINNGGISDPLLKDCDDIAVLVTY